MNVLLTGGAGFVGKYVQKIIPCKHLADEQGTINICDKKRVHEMIASDVPDLVIHLAAQSFVPASFENPKSTFDTNFIGTYNLLESLDKAGFIGRFLYISSSDVYGLVPETKQPIDELRLLRPRSPYAVSKVAAESLCFQWSQTGPFECIIARPFNHIGPGQDERFVVSNFAKQLVEIQAGMRKPVLQVGDIDVSRDFTDVRDVVVAYQKLLASGKNSEIYNICTGTERKIRDLITMMVSELGVEIEIVQDAKRFRRSEQRTVCGDITKLSNELNWVPKITIKQSIRDILKYWKTKINE